MKLYSPKGMARLSTGLSAFAAAGFLVFAIMTDHGGQSGAQDGWKEMAGSALDVTAPVSIESRFASTETQEELQIDNRVTASIESSEPKPQRREPTVLSIIRANNDIAPSVSSGTNRVSVTVKPGDTLYGIGLKHGLSVNDLAKFNGLEEPYTIRVGQRLYVAR